METEYNTLDPKSRIGTAWAGLYAAYEEGDEATREGISTGLKTLCACFGLAMRQRPDLPTTDPQRLEFQVAMDAIVDSSTELHGVIVADMEEMLARFGPLWAARQLGVHRAWAEDPQEWARLIGIILEGFGADDLAATNITHAIVTQLVRLRQVGRN